MHDCNINFDEIGQLPLFKQLPQSALVELIDAADCAHFSDGERLIEEHGENSHLFLIIHGQAHIISGGTLIATAYRNETVGEISASHLSPPVADVVAAGDVDAIRFPINIIDRVSSSHPDFAADLRQTGINKVYG